MTEAEIMRLVQLRATQAGCRLFRNNVGVMIDQRGNRVRFGLATGSSDLIGLRPVVVTPSHVGQTLGQFLSIEVKSAVGKPSPEQRAWLKMVADRSGCGGVVRSVEDLDALLSI